MIKYQKYYLWQYSTIIYKNNGDVLVFGANRGGQLGLGS